MKVLFDTNVLISAGMSSHGKPREALSKAITFYDTYICQASLEELDDTFQRKFPQQLDDLKKFLDLFLPHMKIIQVPEEEIDLEKKIRDEDDRLILRAAVSAEIDIIISGDKDFLESGVKVPAILTPFQFTIWNF